MTRAEAMRKLLALGELRFPDLLETCGWPRAEVQSVLDAEIEAGRITWVNTTDARGGTECAPRASCKRLARCTRMKRIKGKQ